MAKKKVSKMSAKARMAYVRSFIGKKKKKSGGKFPKGTLSEWKAKANSGSASDRAKYKRAIDNWNKLMNKAGFKEKWNANKIRRGGALEDGVNYRDLLNAYQHRNFGMGGAIRAGGIRAGAIRAGGIRAGAIRAGGIRAAGLPPAYFGKIGKKFVKAGGAIPCARGCGYVPGKGLMTPKTMKKFEQIYRRHIRQGAGVTKRDLYRGAGKANSLFFTRDSMLRRQRKKPMTIMVPDDDMVQAYRNLYKHSGYHPENMIDPIVRNDRLKGGNVFKKIGRAVAKPINFVRKHKIGTRIGNVIPGPAGKVIRTGSKLIGAGLIEEAGLNGRGHPGYIYH